MNSEVTQDIVIPKSIHSKAIKKICFVSNTELRNITNLPKHKMAHAKENKHPKVKTILLNKVLEDGKRSYKFGNILVTRMNSDNYFEGEKFRKIVRRLM